MKNKLKSTLSIGVVVVAGMLSQSCCRNKDYKVAPNLKSQFIPAQTKMVFLHSNGVRDTALFLEPISTITTTDEKCEKEQETIVQKVVYTYDNPLNVFRISYLKIFNKKWSLYQVGSTNELQIDGIGLTDYKHLDNYKYKNNVVSDAYMHSSYSSLNDTTVYSISKGMLTYVCYIDGQRYTIEREDL